MRHTRLVAAALLGIAASTALAQSTAFTYQGELKANGTPANGLHDVRFKLFDSAAAGTQVGSTVCINNLQVTNGRFAATIDFGQQFASAGARYLEIEVRQDAGLGCSNSAGYTTLTPRQSIAPAPKAAAANTAFSLSSPDGAPQNALVVDNDGKVGVGTATPGSSLHVMAPNTGLAPGEGVIIQGTQATPANLSYASFLDGAGARVGYVGDGSGGDNSIFLASDSGDVVLNTAGGRVLTALSDGSLRLGTSSADYRHVTIGGGNSEGFLYGSFARFGDGIHMGYNYFADAAGANRIVHADGGTSRISMGYGSISLATAPPFGGSPIDRLVVEESGRVTIGGKPATTGEESLRIVRGEISTAGAVSGGAGFTTSHPGTGAYTITFTPAFSSPPTCTVTTYGGNTGDFAQVTTVNNSQATIVVLHHDGSLKNQAFHFIAVGPR